jgi:maltose O-acetyltransferase
MKLFPVVGRVFWLMVYYCLARHLPESFRLQPIGHFSRGIRSSVCRHIFKSMGKYVNIDRGARFGWGNEIELGDHSGIGTNCQLPASVRIGSDVMIGPDVLVIGQNHKFDRIDIPMRLQGDVATSVVTIEDDVWIGTRSIILPGITIGRGAVIGAGSVVTKNVPPHAVCAGNPARVIRSRKGDSMSEAIVDGRIDS